MYRNRAKAQFGRTHLALKLESVLPGNEFPRSGYPENTDLYWFAGDNEVAYSARGTLDPYGPLDVHYTLNKRGYRSADFEDQAAIRLLSIGAGSVFGLGLPQPDIFHERFAEKLRQEFAASLVNWNVGLPEASNDYIARMLHLLVPRLNPDLVFVLFAPVNRREYLTAHNRYFSYSPESPPPADPVVKELAKQFCTLHNRYDDQLNFLRNYKSIEALLDDRIWIFALAEAGDLDIVQREVDSTRKARDWPCTDHARDQVHPGPETHKLICEAFWAQFASLGGFSKLQELVTPGLRNDR